MDPVPSPVARSLHSGEKVLWWGQPDSWRYVAGGLALTSPLGLVAAGSAAAWVWGARWSEIPVWAVVVLLLVLLFALHMVLLRPLLSFRQARGTFYAVTDRRAVVLCGTRRRLVQELAHDAGEILVIEGIGGPGRVQFGRTAASSWQVLVLGRAAIPGFYGLADLGPALTCLRQQREPKHHR